MCNESRPKEAQYSRDSFLLKHHKDMTLTDFANHFSTPTSNIRRIADRLNIRILPEEVKRALPKTGTLSGDIPTLQELREQYRATPKLPAFMQVFTGIHQGELV